MPSTTFLTIIAFSLGLLIGSVNMHFAITEIFMELDSSGLQLCREGSR